MSFDSVAEVVADAVLGISGVGLVTPCGTTREETWRQVLQGQSAACWLDDEPGFRGLQWPPGWQPSGCPIRGFVAHPACPPGIPQAFQWGISAAFEALAQANLDLATIPPERIGLVIGTSKGDLSEICALTHSSEAATSPLPWWSFAPGGLAAWLAGALEIRGPVLSPVAACATGLLAVQRGLELLRDDVVDVVLAGSVEAPLSPAVWSSYRRLGVLSHPGDNPAASGRPFDLHRTGFQLSCGAGVLVLERATTAAARQQMLLAQCVAWRLLSDAYALTQVDPDATGLTRLIQDVLRRARWSQETLDYINLHGTGTRDNDRYESRALIKALGETALDIPCSSLKGALGHLLGGASAVELGLTVLALRDQIVPPTANWQTRDPDCPLDYVPNVARPARIWRALKLSLGFGGHLSAVALQKP